MKMNRIISAFFVFVMVLSAIPLNVFAATSVTQAEGNITISCEQNYGVAWGGADVLTESNGVVSVTSTGGKYTKGPEYRITVTNSSGKTANITFTYKFEGSGTFSFGDTPKSAGEYPFSQNLGSGESVRLYVQASKSNGKATVRIDSFSCSDIPTDAKATFYYDEAKALLRLGVRP